MAVKAAELESELIDAVCERVREHLPEQQAAAAEAFVRQYYHWVPADDLSDRSPSDLCGAALAQWALMQQRGARRDQGPRLQPGPRAGRLAARRTRSSRSSPTTCRSSSTR